MNDRANEPAIEEILALHRALFQRVSSGRPSDWLGVDLTMAQWKTMMVLYYLGQRSMGELAESLGAGLSTVTGIVDRLVAHGLVSRQDDPNNRRVVVGTLTPTGLALIDRLQLNLSDRLRRVLLHCSAEELDLLVRASRLLHVASAREFPEAERAGETEARLTPAREER